MKCEWKTVKLGDIAEFNKFTYSVKDEWKFVNYLDTGNITENRIEAIQYIDLFKESLPSRAKRKVKNCNIIYSTVRPNQLHYGYIKEQPNNFLVSTGFAVIDVNEEFANSQFIYYFLTQNSITDYLHSIAEQSVSAYPSIKSSDLADVEINLPDLETQKKIAKVLSALDDKIEQNNAINHNLQQQAQAIFRSWFIENEESISWPYGVFADLLTGIVGGDWGKDSPAGNNTEMVYCIRGADIPEVCAGNKGKMPIRYILLKNYLAKRLVEGDIVVEISGGSPTQSTGRVAVISKALLDRYDKGMVCTNFCRALKPLAGYSMYIYHYWQYLYDKGVFFSYENGTTGIKNLDINGFAETEPIIIAPIKEIKKFDELCQNIYSKIYANGLENEKLAILRDTLLPKLMSGELDVSEVEI